MRYCHQQKGKSIVCSVCLFLSLASLSCWSLFHVFCKENYAGVQHDEGRSTPKMVSWQLKSSKVEEYRQEIRESIKEIERVGKAVLQTDNNGANSTFFEDAVKLLMQVGQFYFDMGIDIKKGEELLWTCVEVATKELPSPDVRLKGLSHLALFYGLSTETLEKAEGVYHMFLSERRHLQEGEYARCSLMFSQILLRQGKLEEARRFLDKAVDELGLLRLEHADNKAEAQLFDLHTDVAAFMEEDFDMISASEEIKMRKLKKEASIPEQELSFSEEATKRNAKNDDQEQTFKEYLEAAVPVHDVLLSDRDDDERLSFYHNLIASVLDHSEQVPDKFLRKRILGCFVRTAQKLRRRLQKKHDDALLELMQEKRKEENVRKSSKKKAKNKARESNEKLGHEGKSGHKVGAADKYTRSTEDDNEAAECAICLLDLLQGEEDDK